MTGAHISVTVDSGDVDNQWEVVRREDEDTEDGSVTITFRLKTSS